MPIALSLDNLRHRFGTTPILDGVTAHVEAGQLLSFLGPSGSGKSTILRAIAGLMTPDEGEITIGGRVVVDGGRETIRCEDRGVGLMFQDYALFPNLSVAKNIAYGLRRPNPARVSELIERFELSGLDDRKPSALSGGQQQRVALARALAPEPSLLLLDEPFANIDAELRASLGSLLRGLIQGADSERPRAGVLVTHDREAALSLSDQVAVLVPGPNGAQIAQVGSPEAVYRQPISVAVARLTGPLWTLDGDADGHKAATVLGPIACPLNGPVVLMVRPEDARFEPGVGACRVTGRSFFGAGWLAELDTPAGPVRVSQANAPELGATGAVIVRRAHAIPRP